jgi:hypothetical protein
MPRYCRAVYHWYNIFILIRKGDMRILLLLVVMLSSVVLLTGCGEVLNEYYLSNHTAGNLTVRLTVPYPEAVDLTAGPLQTDIRRSARSQLTEPVAATQQGDTLSFTVPPNTSLLLGISSGGNVMFSRLEISGSAPPLDIEAEGSRDYFTVHDYLIGPVVHVLNVY